MTKDWQFILLYGVIILPLWRWFSIWDYKRMLKRRETKFLKMVKVQFPDASYVTFTAIETSDKQAMTNLVRERPGECSFSTM
jgi:hypothetical protein